MQSDEELIAGFVADCVQRMDEETFALFAQVMEEIHNSWDPALDAAGKPQTAPGWMKRALYEILFPGHITIKYHKQKGGE